MGRPGTAQRGRVPRLRRGRSATCKIVLPNFGVFDEQRYFVPGEGPNRSRWAGSAWASRSARTSGMRGGRSPDYRGVPLVTNINGSPYHRRKLEERLGVLRDRAREFGPARWMHVNAVGEQDELVFDGGSVVVGPDGEIACRAPFFEEDLLIVDVDDDGAARSGTRPGSRPPASIAWSAGGRPPRLRPEERVRRRGARPLGRDRLGVRGGARRALGPDSVHVLAMPSPFSSPESLEDAADVAGRLGSARHRVGRVFDAYRSTRRNPSSRERRKRT